MSLPIQPDHITLAVQLARSMGGATITIAGRTVRIAK